jgi:murein DD-endopeptidase MepM/ murein hydrolase activator NlpD
VAVDHGAGLMSYYFHLSKILVTEGQMVSAGEVIAEVGSEGLSTGPHLHWEMRVHQQASNPLAWVGRLFPGGAQQ